MLLESGREAAAFSYPRSSWRNREVYIQEMRPRRSRHGDGKRESLVRAPQCCQCIPCDQIFHSLSDLHMEPCIEPRPSIAAQRIFPEDVRMHGPLIYLC